jgi:hypothetical protein
MNGRLLVLTGWMLEVVCIQDCLMSAYKTLLYGNNGGEIVVRWGSGRDLSSPRRGERWTRRSERMARQDLRARWARRRGLGRIGVPRPQRELNRQRRVMAYRRQSKNAGSRRSGDELKRRERAAGGL